ncbi:MAG: hypothetical protein QM775_13125 [Pirellulales bacterium]
MARERSFLEILWSAVTAPFRGLLWLWQVCVVAPYYDVTSSFGAIFGRVFRSFGGRGPIGIVLDILLWPFRLTWSLITSTFQWLWWALGTWPKLMKFQDLGWGLPALLVAAVAVPLLTVVHTNDNTLLSGYQERMQEAFEGSSKSATPEEKEKQLKTALFYARSLSQLRPLDRSFRFNLAMLYGGLGDESRSMSIMSELAPRDSVGFGPAHFTQARQILMRPLNADDFNSAVAH